ncbi:MAG: hypothetical protein Q9222_001684 [Ikaeria aurantiellina]
MPTLEELDHRVRSLSTFGHWLQENVYFRDLQIPRKQLRKQNLIGILDGLAQCLCREDYDVVAVGRGKGSEQLYICANLQENAARKGCQSGWDEARTNEFSNGIIQSQADNQELMLSRFRDRVNGFVTSSVYTAASLLDTKRGQDNHYNYPPFHIYAEGVLVFLKEVFKSRPGEKDRVEAFNIRQGSFIRLVVGMGIQKLQWRLVNGPEKVSGNSLYQESPFHFPNILEGKKEFDSEVAAAFHFLLRFCYTRITNIIDRFKSPRSSRLEVVDPSASYDRGKNFDNDLAHLVPVLARLHACYTLARGKVLEAVLKAVMGRKVGASTANAPTSPLLTQSSNERTSSSDNLPMETPNDKEPGPRMEHGKSENDEFKPMDGWRTNFTIWLGRIGSGESSDKSIAPHTSEDKIWSRQDIEMMGLVDDDEMDIDSGDDDEEVMLDTSALFFAADFEENLTPAIARLVDRIRARHDGLRSQE